MTSRWIAALRSVALNLPDLAKKVAEPDELPTYESSADSDDLLTQQAARRCD